MSEVDEAIALLRSGQVIGLPTETVYGLAADGTQTAAVLKIFSIKGRPHGHPLILHLGDASWLSTYCCGDLRHAQILARKYWPGPLTLVLRRVSAQVPNAVTGGLETVAVRVPDHPVAREVILGLGCPVAAPSANRFGGVSPTKREHVVADLGDAVPLVVEGGACSIGLESTILDLSRSSPYLLRSGAVSRADIEETLGEQVLLDDGFGPAAPGTLESHYAPRAQVVLVERQQLWAKVSELSETCKVGVLAILGVTVPPQLRAVVYEVSGDAGQAAHELYAGLRELDKLDCDVIVSPIPELKGIGVAISDRLGRAAAPRG